MSEINEKETGLEEMLGELDGIIEKMQGGQLSLEETFEDYKKGVDLVEKCSKKIEKIECDIKLLNPDEE